MTHKFVEGAVRTNSVKKILDPALEPQCSRIIIIIIITIIIIYQDSFFIVLSS